MVESTCDRLYFFNEAQKCPRGEVPLVFVPIGDPWGTPLQVETSYAWGPVKPPRGQPLRSPRPKVTSVPARKKTEGVSTGYSPLYLLAFLIGLRRFSPVFTGFHRCIFCPRIGCPRLLGAFVLTCGSFIQPRCGQSTEVGAGVPHVVPI